MLAMYMQLYIFKGKSKILPGGPPFAHSYIIDPQMILLYFAYLPLVPVEECRVTMENTNVSNVRVIPLWSLE